MYTLEEWFIIGLSIFVIVLRLAYFLYHRCLSKLRALPVAHQSDECAGVRLLSWRPLEDWDAPESHGPHLAEPEDQDFAPPSYSSLQLDLPPPYPKDCRPAESDLQYGSPPSYSEICVSQRQPQHQLSSVLELPPPPPPPHPPTPSTEPPHPPTLCLIDVEVTRL
ncbi:wiskott-Aldrich syndrome protein family member 2-like [Clupea harengus]|uniref:Wiskott-Aldrich syndrome protein family member 2-like n=1 Tax=Clupea harengus TaxID=7950 RepID=A0A6P8FJB6_CLUHA|nr:wiskott-Aldrich syndrome protein family member 2-like [Clupea harengus]